jgi:hypothetical protein
VQGILGSLNFEDKNLLTESADKNKTCCQETSSYKICLRKERHLAMEKILKYLVKGHMINATTNVPFKSIPDTLDVNIYGKSYAVIYSKTSSNN